MLTESQRQEQYRRTVYAPAQDARKAYWQSMWERSMHNPLNKKPSVPEGRISPNASVHHGDVDEFTHPNTPPPRTAWSKDPWPDARGTTTRPVLEPNPLDYFAGKNPVDYGPNAPCCGVGGDVEAAVSAELARILALFRERQAKYGPKNIAEFGEVGVLVRLYDKLARLRNFYFDGGVGDMADESVEDAWSDISCYAAIALVCKRGRWPGAKPFLGGAK